MIIGKISVMHKGLVKTDKGMSTGRVPDPPFCWVSLVGDPNMGLKVIQLVILNDLFRISNDFQDKKVAAVGHDKCLLSAHGVVICFVDIKTVLVDKLILGLSLAEPFQTLFLYKRLEDLRFYPDKIPPDIRRTNFQTLDISVIRHMWDTLSKIHLEPRLYKPLFKVIHNPVLEYGNLQNVVLFKNFL